MVPVDAGAGPLLAVVMERTAGWGADVVFEAGGSLKAFDDLVRVDRPGGAVVLVGLPVEPVRLDVSAAI